jgi:hypothetical protein
MSPLAEIDKARVFISSLNRYKLGKRTLSKIREDLVAEIQARFPFLCVEINEQWLAAGAGEPRATTEHRARTCHLFVGILVDSYGYQDPTGLSATQIEFEAAREDSREKMLVFVQDRLRDPKVLEAQPESYKDLLEELQGYQRGKILQPFSTEEDLKQGVLAAIEKYCADTLRAIRRFPPYASSKTQEETEWELMTFAERFERMRAVLREEAGDVEPVGTSVHRLSLVSPGVTADRFLLEVDTPDGRRQIPVLASFCPDRFSYTDAARYVGYPFRTDMEKWADEIGPFHLVCLYRTITDTQIRRHLGNPDIHVSREKWGFYVLDPERFIQAVYLQSCQSPQVLLNRVRQFLAWLHEYGQIPALVRNAERRGRILRARV